MKVTKTDIPGVLWLEPRLFGDARGFFTESYNRRAFAEATGVDPVFVQDNHSRSQKNVLRGLHYQVEQPQGKLVRVARGRIFDVVVDIRKESPTYGKWSGVVLDENEHRQVWIPPRLAHGFVVLSDVADLLYKTTDYYAPQYERSLAWDDPDLGIDWPLDGPPILSDKDRAAARFAGAEFG